MTICSRCRVTPGSLEEAEFRVTVLSPPAAVRDNPPEQLCGLHAQQAADAYIGWGWGVLVLNLAEIEVREG